MKEEKKKSFAEQVLNYCLEIGSVPLTAPFTVQRPKCLSPGSEPLSAASDKQLGIQGSSSPAGDLCVPPAARAVWSCECPSGSQAESTATWLLPLPKQSLNCSYALSLGLNLPLVVFFFSFFQLDFTGKETQTTCENNKRHQRKRHLSENLLGKIYL